MVWMIGFMILQRQKRSILIQLGIDREARCGADCWNQRKIRVEHVCVYPLIRHGEFKDALLEEPSSHNASVKLHAYQGLVFLRSMIPLSRPRDGTYFEDRMGYSRAYASAVSATVD